ncbi:MAG: hypothetical protein ACN4GK_04035 [Acidimicrobiia bacterium]
MRSRKTLLMAAIAALALLLSACSVNIERNQDGSLQVDGEITAESLAAEFERDPDNNSVDVSIDDGVLWLDVEGVDENGDYVANLRVELTVTDGTLAVDITEAFYNGWTVPEEIRDEFNKEIAKEIKKAVNQNPDATLLSLVADDGRITTEWRVDTKDSKKG